MKSFFKLLIIVSYITQISDYCLAQKHNNIWYFGKNAGIDFTSGIPVALTDGAMFTDEGAAVISDSSGNLLFYSNGVKVWNALHDTMDNGNNLYGCSSTTQSIIVPKPGIEDSIYFLFYAGCYVVNIDSGFRYAIIDMKLNNGLGKVVQKNVLLHKPATEKVTTVTHANGYDFWVITHEWNSNNFLTYLITCNGLDIVPIISSAGTPLTNTYNVAGFLKASPDGKKLAMAADNSFVELYDFDNVTGIVSNAVTLPGDSLGCEYGITFSTDNSKLYTDNGCSPYGKINQFNLTAGTTIDIVNSKTLIFSQPCTIFPPDTCPGYGGMQIAPDGKVYVAHYTGGMIPGDDTFLGVIKNPDSSGLACDYVHNGFSLAGKVSSVSLPNLIDTYFKYISIDSTSCYTCMDPVSLFSYTNSMLTVYFTSSSTNSEGWIWNFGDFITDTVQNPIHTYDTAGIYNVCLISTNTCGSDTFCYTLTIINTAIKYNEPEDFVSIYPNPSMDKIYLKVNLPNEFGFTIEVFNSTGELIFQNTVKQKHNKIIEVDFNHKAGLYIFKINIDNKIIRRKITHINHQ